MESSLVVDLNNIDKKLAFMGKKALTINKRCISKVVAKGRSEARKATYKTGLKRHSGDLRRSIKSKTMIKNGKITARVWSSKGYASVQEFGKTILPVKSNYLTIDFDGDIRRVKKVVIKANPFFFQTVESYFNGSLSNAILNKELQRQLKKYWEKN